MYIAKSALITLVAFAFLIGCGTVGQKAEMSQETTTATVDAEEKPMDKLTVPTPKKAAYQEVTLQVEGMT